MANEILIKTGTTQICFADHADDFAPAAANSLEEGTPTDCQMTFASLADGSYRQSAKVDLGATRPRTWRVHAALEFAATPTAGSYVFFYWAESPKSTAANGNPGGASGSDSAFTGYSANAANSVEHMKFIGMLRTTAQATGTVQIANIGELVTGSRYGSLIIRNDSGASLHSDDVESHVVFDPVIDEVQ